MPEREGKQPKRGKSTVSNDNHEENVGQRDDARVDEEDASSRGDAVTSGGNKIHGDELEGIIPGRPSQRHTDKKSQ